MAPVICVAVSQRLGRSHMDNGSWAETCGPTMRHPCRDRDAEISFRGRSSCVADTTAGVRLNNYVYAPRSARMQPIVHSCRKQAETLCQLTAVGTVWRDGCRFLTQVGDGGRYSCYPELPRCDADEASLRSLSDLPDGLFPDIIATRWLSVVGHVVQRAGWPGPPGRQFVAIGPLWRLAAAFGLA